MNTLTGVQGRDSSDGGNPRFHRNPLELESHPAIECLERHQYNDPLARPVDQGRRTWPVSGSLVAGSVSLQAVREFGG